MSWAFKSLVRTGPQSGHLTELSPEQELRKNRYTASLIAALNSKVPSPPFSNYHVRGGIAPAQYGLIGLHAGNIEYGLCQALHCEESAVAALAAYRSSAGDTGVPVLAFPERPGRQARIATTPCGNCRDILLDAFGPDLEIVCGPSGGGRAVVSRLADYLIEEYPRQTRLDGPHDDYSLHNFTRAVQDAIAACARLEHDAYSPPTVHPERRYGAALHTLAGWFYGARDIMCDYHPIYALRDAVRQARRARAASLLRVFIVCPAWSNPVAPPHVMYKDRQHLGEWQVELNLTTGQDTDAPISLVTYDPDTLAPLGIWETTVREWLPFPFLPSAFGLAFLEQLREYYQTR